jgi:carboxypeptidase Taq
MVDAAYAQLIATLRQHADLAAALQLLEWDQETYMPAAVVDGRARQIGTLATLLHRRQTAPEFLDLVDGLASDLSALSLQQAVDVRETKWRLDRQRALDPELVRARSVLHAQGRAVWIGARERNDFDALAPFLFHIIDLERRVAAAIDPSREAYEVLLEDYEPGASVAAIEPIFTTLRDGLLPLTDRLKGLPGPRPGATSVLCGDFPLAAQRRFNHMVSERLGFDFNRGRLDEAAHPFSTSIGGDVRLTTRYAEHDLTYALYSTLHETGHGLYEQGLDPSAWGTPRGQSCSLGIHESQSRLWENFVGRTEAFWSFVLPIAQAMFPALAGASLPLVVSAVNVARPSLIRTEADEITYNLHIIMRFELERALVEGSLQVAALPEVWRQMMQEYIGIVPDTDSDGVLQDIHWASGAFGYFPTYALGNIYAAQLMRAAEADVGSLEAAFSAGEFGVLLRWLRDHVHRLGRTYRAGELITAATGKAPTCQPLLQHLAHKLAFLESI